MTFAAVHTLRLDAFVRHPHTPISAIFGPHLDELTRDHRNHAPPRPPGGDGKSDLRSDATYMGYITLRALGHFDGKALL